MRLFRRKYPRAQFKDREITKANGYGFERSEVEDLGREVGVRLDKFCRVEKEIVEARDGYREGRDYEGQGRIMN